MQHLAVHVDPGPADDRGADVRPPGRPGECGPGLSRLPAAAARLLLQLADAALDGHLDGVHDDAQLRIPVTVHRLQELVRGQLLRDAEGDRRRG